MVAKYEEAGSPTERWTWERGHEATRVIRCEWVDRFTVANELIPLRYPYIDIDDIWVLDIAFAPAPGRQQQGGTEDVATYEDALLTLLYGTPEAGEPPADIEYATERIMPSGEFITLPPSQHQWRGTTTVLKKEEAPGKLYKTLEYQYSRTGVTIVPSAVKDLVGHVNNTWIYPTSPGLSGLQFGPETLLYQPPVMSRRLTSAGTTRWDMTFKFLWRPNFQDGTQLGWNYFWRSETGAYEQIERVKDNGVQMIYPSGNFLAIIT